MDVQSVWLFSFKDIFISNSNFHKFKPSTLKALKLEIVEFAYSVVTDEAV